MLSFIFKSVLVCSLSGTLLFLFFTAIRPLSQRFFTSSWHYFIGLMIVLVMLCPIRSGVFKRVEIKPVSVTHEEENDTIKTASYENSYEENYSETEAKNESKKEKAMEYLSCAWLICTCALLIKQSLFYHAYINKLNRSTFEVKGIYVPFRTDVRVRMGKDISSPMVSGLFSKTLYLPEKTFSEKELSAVLSHEVIHLKRRDLIAKRLISTAKCVHFFNPAIYFLARRIELDCEISCDLAATKTMSSEERQSYMLTILNLVPNEAMKFSPLSVGIISGKETLKRRFLKIINREKISKKTKLISAFIAVILITASLCVSGVLASGIEKPEKKSENNNVETTLPFESEITASTSAKDKVTEPNKSAQTDFVPTTVETMKSEAVETLLMPCAWTKITSEFGTWKVGDKEIFHDGVDFLFSQSSDIFASADGKVEFSGWDKENNYEDGISVVIVTDAGTKLIYKHLDSVSVNAGDYVRAGEVIAKSGSTGNATGICLHFSVVRDGKFADPMEYFR